MHLLLARWTEPSEGSCVWTADLTDDEVSKVEGIIDWLKNHAGQEWGYCLCSWQLVPAKVMGDADLVGVDRVIREIALNSRYNETGTPGEFYGGNRNAALEGS